MLIIREDLSKYPLPDEKLNQIIQAHSNWAKALYEAGKFIDGHGISNKGKLVEKVNEQIEVNELRDIKEGIGGYYVLDVKDMDEAIAIAKHCPTFDEGDLIEVRPLL